MEEEEEEVEGDRKRDFKELSFLPDPPPSVDEVSTLYSLLVNQVHFYKNVHCLFRPVMLLF